MDTLILIVLLVGAVIGFVQGAFKQIANFLGVTVGIVLAVALYDQFGHYLADATGASDGIGNVIAFVLIVVIVPVALGLLASMLTKLAKKAHLGCVNRGIGALIGMVCYGLRMSVVFNLMDFALSNGGLKPEKLEQRTELYYQWKHAAQWAVPDVIIVTDSCEEAQGCTPHHGISAEIPAFLGGEKE